MGNFAVDVVERAPPERLAIVELARDGTRREWSFGQVAQAARGLAAHLHAAPVQVRRKRADRERDLAEGPLPARLVARQFDERAAARGRRLDDGDGEVAHATAVSHVTRALRGAGKLR